VCRGGKMSSRPDSSCARLDRHGRNSASSCIGSRVQHPICCRPCEQHCTAARRLRRRRRRVLHVWLPPPPRPSVRLSVCLSDGSARMLAPPSLASRKRERAPGQVGTQARHLGVLEPGGVNEPPNDYKMSFFVQLRKLKTANQL